MLAQVGHGPGVRRGDDDPGDAALGGATLDQIHRHGDWGQRPGPEHRADRLLRDRRQARSRALNATISTALRFGPVFGELVNPSGLVQSAASSPTPPRTRPATGTELHVLRPDAGRWTLIVDFVDPVSGRAAMAPFTVSIDDHAVRATQTGLPTSVHAMLPAGKPVIARLRITNNSPFPQEYFVDARHGGLVRLPLLPLVPARYGCPTWSAACPPTWCRRSRTACRPRCARPGTFSASPGPLATQT